MAIIKPFRAYRPVDSLVKYVAAPPYDVVNSEEARELVKDNKYSYLDIYINMIIEYMNAPETC